MHYGYIGLGNLGAACAGCLLKAGFPVTVYDLNPALADPLIAQGATLATSAEALAGQVDHVLTCLPSPAVSERVLRNILPHMKPGAHWLEMSTLGRDEVLKLAAIASQAGVRMMELPVTGGVHLAYQGKITMLAGGDRDLFDLHRGLDQLAMDRDKLIACFDHYLALEGKPITRAVAEQRMLEKLTRSLIEDIAPLLPAGVRFNDDDAIQAFERVWEELIVRIKGDAWKLTDKALEELRAKKYPGLLSR